MCISGFETVESIVCSDFVESNCSYIKGIISATTNSKTDTSMVSIHVDSVWRQDERFRGNIS